MAIKIFKRLPYGTSDFRSIRTENYVYVDKTRFIESWKTNSTKTSSFSEKIQDTVYDFMTVTKIFFRKPMNCYIE
ncbi:MAG: AAA family ATPase [Dysgonamonadaceae bacterium]|jgi:hypothetical protein|nr:AAA family ATPase [Dysgonamonadaceae bacterium]